jgi:hypothetical protein
MRVFVIAAVIAWASAPALASPACMTQSEARQKFPTQHLWWHGPNRCWDATPSRTQLGKRINTRSGAREAQADREAGRDAAQESPREKIVRETTVAPEKSAVQQKKPQNWAHDGRWREAMSRMLPEDEPPAEPQAQVRLDNTPDKPRAAPAPQMNWRDRWIDMPASRRGAAAAAPAVMAADAEPIVTPTRVMLALLAVVLTLGFVELVFRKTQPDWRR